MHWRRHWQRFELPIADPKRVSMRRTLGDLEGVIEGWQQSQHLALLVDNFGSKTATGWHPAVAATRRRRCKEVALTYMRLLSPPGFVAQIGTCVSPVE